MKNAIRFEPDSRVADKKTVSAGNLLQLPLIQKDHPDAKVIMKSVESFFLTEKERRDHFEADMLNVCWKADELGKQQRAAQAGDEKDDDVV